MSLRTLLEHPLTRGVDLDSPRATHLHRRMVREKGLLRRIYEEWYDLVAEALPAGSARVVELGSGGGFLGHRLPGLLTSELFPVPGVRLALDGHALPFGDGALGGIVMTNVLHHLDRPETFFAEAERCVKPGGALVMIEPWMTGWSRFVYDRLHHEPCDPRAREWRFAAGGPLSAANIAVPWMVFERDRVRFRERFPGWELTRVELLMPFVYLLSGGASMRSFMPSWSYRLWRGVEGLLRPWRGRLAMFALVVVKRVPARSA